MCFNLFGPLINNRVLARHLLAPLVPERVVEVTCVAIEWAPVPCEAYLGDHTAFDAFIEYRTTKSRLCALAIETKLSEPFSQKHYDGEHYRRWMRVPDAPWRADASEYVANIKHNQLWRDHLLAVAVRHQPNSAYAISRLMLVRHPDDGDCGRVLASYRHLLRDNDNSLLDMPLDRLTDVWMKAMADGTQRDWIQEFRVRYLELERSAQRTNVCP